MGVEQQQSNRSRAQLALEPTSFDAWPRVSAEGSEGHEPTEAHPATPDPRDHVRTQVELADVTVERMGLAAQAATDPAGAVSRAFQMPNAPDGPETSPFAGAHTALGALHGGLNLGNAVEDARRGDGAAALQHGGDGVGQLVSLAGDLSHSAPMTNGGNAISSLANVTSDLRDINSNGATGANVNNLVTHSVNSAGAVSALAGVPGANAVAAAYGVGNQVGTAVHDTANQHAVATGEYGVDHVTARGVNASPGAEVNRNVDDNAALQGGRTMMNDLHNGHGETYANVHGAAVAVGTGLADTARSAREEAMDQAGGYDPNTAARWEHLLGTHIPRPSEIANLNQTDPATADAYLRAHPHTHVELALPH